MTTPSTSLATLRPDLASSFMEFDLEMDQLGFIGLSLFPVIETMKQAGTFGRIKLAEMLRDQESVRAPGASYNRGEGRFDTLNFATVEHGFEEAIDDRESEMFADFFDAEQLAAMRARDVVVRNYEKRIAALALAITNTNAAAFVWSDAAQATPIVDVKNANLAIFDRTGLIPNVLAITWKQFQHLKDVDEIVERIKFSGRDDPKRAGINQQVLADVFGLDRVIVTGSRRNTANEGAATPILSSIFADQSATLARVALTDDPREACWGRTFHWGEDGSTIGGMVETYRDEPKRSDIARNRMDTDEKVLLDAAAQKITAVLA